MKNLIKRINSKDFWTKLFFPFIGIASLVWFLIRVIPRPSRASYPCMRVAAPLASSFVIYIVSLVGSLSAFKYAKILFKDARYLSGILALIVFLSLGTWFVFDSAEPVKALIVQDLPVNEPMGVGRGIFPGRVVWSWNPDATNEDCDPYEFGNTWYNQGNYDQAVVDEMLSDVIQELTGQVSDSAAWKAIFEYHNNNVRSKGVVNYSPGEKIFIKINATSAWGGQFDPEDLSDVDHPWGDDYDFISETSPAIVMAVLKQLVHVVGVAQSDIYVGDPMKHIYKHNYDYWHNIEFPDVHYLDQDNTYSHLGREQAVKGTTARIYYSDNGTILRPQVWSGPGGDEPIHNDNLYQIFEDAEYLINLPMLKGHKRAGMTMFAKNHFGSHIRDDASHLHNGLVAPAEMENGIDRPGYGLYRVQVDLMAHSILGKKNLVYIMDALWATDYELDRPLKWQMAPFNNDWMSSIFASFDPVAIESVGHDFLRSEFTPERGAGTYVQMEGVDDYLHQAADSSNWPDDIIYDPDSTGILFASLGVHEHWNSAANMQYTRDLEIGNGIELVKLLSALVLYNPLVDLSIEKNAADTTLDLSDVFLSPSNDSISLSLLNQTNETLVTATIGDSSLTLSFTPNMIGTDTITVQATASGQSTTDQFIVTVQPALYLNNPIPDIIVFANDPDKIIDLSAVFQDISGASITYTIVNQTNTDLVTATLQDSALTLDFNPAFSGIAIITIQATVPGESLTDEFEITVNPATAITNESDLIPLEYSLSQNYPNPFNPETTIKYALPKISDVVISIYDINGRHITDILKANKSAGYHTIKWNASDLTSGLYLYQIKAENFTQVKKCILVK